MLQGLMEFSFGQHWLTRSKWIGALDWLMFAQHSSLHLDRNLWKLGRLLLCHQKSWLKLRCVNPRKDGGFTMRYMDLARHQRIGLSTGITPCRVSNGILVKSTCISKKKPKGICGKSCNRVQMVVWMFVLVTFWFMLMTSWHLQKMMLGNRFSTACKKNGNAVMLKRLTRTIGCVFVGSN